jgi:hypothetical protein
MGPSFRRRFTLQNQHSLMSEPARLSMPRDRIVPLIIAVALFMENVDLPRRLSPLAVRSAKSGCKQI